MMRSPILYHPFSDGDGSDGLGLGVLSDAISCVVTEELNGVFELHMTYPMKGRLFEQMAVNGLIKVDAGHQLKGQLFRIERIETDFSGVARIYAPHVSSEVKHIVGRRGFFPRTPNRFPLQWFILNLQNWHSTIHSRFEITTDISLDASRSESHFERDIEIFTLHEYLRALREGWGGDFMFDNYRISYQHPRGVESDVVVAYGKNLVGFKRDENLIDVFTAILPIARYDDQVLVGEIIRSSNANMAPHPRTKVVDLTSRLQENEFPLPYWLRSKGQEYVESKLNMTPNVSIEIDFVEDQRTTANGERFETLNLGDHLRVYFEDAKIYARARVVRMEWDVLMDRYLKIEVGTVSQRFRDGVKRIIEGGN